MLDGKDTAQSRREISNSRQVDVWQHRTPKGVRNRLVSDDYKHGTPTGWWDQITLLIGLPFVFEPPSHMSSLRVVVCPVNDSALRIPNVLAVKRNTVAFLQSIN